MGFNIGIHKYPLTFGTVVDSNFQPNTGLQNDTDVRFIRIDTGAVIAAAGFTEIGNGKYEFWNFAIPDIVFSSGGADYQGCLELAVQLASGTAWNTQAQCITVYKDANQFDGYNDRPPSRTYVDNRADRMGDTLFGYFTDSPSGSFTGLNPTDWQHINKIYADTHYAPLSVSGYATALLSSNNIWTGTNNFNGGLTAKLFSGKDFCITQQSSPANGDIMGLRVYCQTSNKVAFDFRNSSLSVTGASSSATINDIRIQTSDPTYINGNPAQNRYVWRKWVSDNFQPIVSTYSSNTVVVDSNVVDKVSLKLYANVNDALTDITAETLSSTNIWTIFVKQHTDLVYGYQENIEIPDYVNIIGEGQVLITGQLTRSGLDSRITSKIQNLQFYCIDVAHDVDRLDATDCIFEVNGVTVEDQIVLTDSNLKNCGFYGTVVNGNPILSNGGNKFISCFGNADLVLTGTDKEYSYTFNEGDIYYSY
jgi:hypothetical protein